ncbi:carboxypeptidase family protein [Lacinutrix venerupis]|uniref:carboxypeptidase-like regulatory domain-containing protein n=1 Tax=Lacinutrix venerupis TaxID=1486034 RepID=UPI000EAF99F5|nr:carboxypeptidase-like regulatory domain-containing protein [Lacinutrix venerupis]RLJ68811.1 carboxypeptidase family protein [Lacinutrix venerupis]
MKPIILSAFILLFLFSCSKDEAPDAIPESINISGKLLAPNNQDPIVNARVSAMQNNILKAETTTDAQGNFTIALEKGEYTLNLAKGLFTTQKQIVVEQETTLDNYKIDTLPNIGVITGSFDNIESVLYGIGLVNPITNEPLFDIIDGITTNKNSHISNQAHLHGLNKSSDLESRNPILDPNVSFSYTDLMSDPTLLASYDILFINCSSHSDNPTYEQNLMDYVNNGGFLYVTDWSSSLLNTVTNNDTDYLSFYTPRRSGQSLSTTATILDGNLSAWLLLNFGISINDTVFIDEFLGSWQVVDSYDPTTTISWLNGVVDYRDNNNVTVTENKDLAFTFLLGQGAVFYSSFHTENDEFDFTTTDRIMEYLVFEMTAIE